MVVLRRGRDLAAVGRDHDVGRGGAGVQLRVPAAGGHLHHRRPAELGGAGVVPGGQPRGQQPLGGGPGAGQRGDRPARRAGPALRPEPRRAGRHREPRGARHARPVGRPALRPRLRRDRAAARRDWDIYDAGASMALDPRELASAFAAAQTTLEFDAYARTYAGHRTMQSEGGTVRLVPLRVGTQADRPAGGRGPSGRSPAPSMPWPASWPSASSGRSFSRSARPAS